MTASDGLSWNEAYAVAASACESRFGMDCNEEYRRKQVRETGEIIALLAKDLFVRSQKK